jgi:hypothetical protein
MTVSVVPSMPAIVVSFQVVARPPACDSRASASPCGASLLPARGRSGSFRTRWGGAVSIEMSRQRFALSVRS